MIFTGAPSQKYLPNHLPGKPGVIVQNITGSGSIQASQPDL